MQAGEEFGRTKFGDGNSYRSNPEINMLRWKQTEEFSDLLEYYKGLIRLRKRMPGLCDKTATAPKHISDKKVHQEIIQLKVNCLLFIMQVMTEKKSKCQKVNGLLLQTRWILTVRKK